MIVNREIAVADTVHQTEDLQALGIRPIEEYRAFIQRKVTLSKNAGIEIEQDEINPMLKPHQRDCVQWAVQGGRRAIFARFGLGKTVMQLDIAKRIIEQYSMPNETVLDPFSGIGTVPMCAIEAGRKAIGIELSQPYFLDGAVYVESAAKQVKIPTLLDLAEVSVP